MTLYTKPTCKLVFYTNFEASMEVASGCIIEPCTLFSVCTGPQPGFLQAMTLMMKAQPNTLAPVRITGQKAMGATGGDPPLGPDSGFMGHQKKMESGAPRALPRWQPRANRSQPSVSP